MSTSEPAPESSPAAPSRSRTSHILRWVIGLAITAAVWIPIGLATWYFTRSMPRITAYIQVRAERPKLAFETGSERGDPNAYQIFKNSQAAMIRNPFVINRALNEPGITNLLVVREQADPVLWLTNELDVTFDKDSEIMQVSLSGDNTKELVELVNAIVDAYLEEANTRARNELLMKRESLERRHVELQKQIEKKTQMYQTLAEQLGTPDSTAAVNKANMDRQQLEMLWKTRESNSERLLDVTLELQTREAELAAAESYKPSQATIDYELSKDADYQEKLVTLREHEEMLKKLKTTVDTQKSQAIEALIAAFGGAKTASAEQKFRARVERFRKEVEDYKSRAVPLIVEALKGSKTDATEALKLRVAAERQKQMALTARVDELDKKIEDLTVNLTLIGKSTAQLEMIKNELDYLNVTFKEVAKQLEAVKTELDAPNRILLLQKAEPPEVSFPGLFDRWNARR